MNRKTGFLLLLLSAVAMRSFAQTDSVSLQYAKNALDVTHNCEDALHFLNMVSDNGKKTVGYNLYMGRVQDCKMNREQAIYYYSKYLEYKPADDSVKLRIAQLKDINNGGGVTANEERVSKAAKQQNTLKHKKHKRKNLYDNYASVGLGYLAGLGSDAPYRQGISLNVADGFPIIHNKAVIEINIDGDFLFGANNTWYTNAFLLQPGTSVNAGIGYYDMITVGFMPVLMNRKNSSLVAGVFGGINFAMLGAPNQDTYNAPIYSNPTLFALAYGVKVNYYLGDNFMMFAQLNLNSVSSIQTDTYTGTVTSPVSLTSFNIGAAFKFSSYWFW